MSRTSKELTTDNYQILEWDSKIFGYEVAKITRQDLSRSELQEVLDNLRLQQIKLAYWAQEEESTIAKECSGKMVDKKVTYMRQLDEVYSIEKNNNIKSWLHKPLEDRILSLALQSGKYSRFKVDKNFTRNEYYKLYSAWIKGSLEGSIAKEVLVYQFDLNNIVGLLTINFDREESVIGLLSVDAKYRHLGVGRQLMLEAFNLSKTNAAQEIFVSTQSRNKIACKFYEKMGFVSNKVIYIYHFWL